MLRRGFAWPLLGLLLSMLLVGAGQAKAQGEDWEHGQVVSDTGPTGTGLPIISNPLAPPETSSPRQTLFSYLLDTREASQILEHALKQHETEEGLFPSEAVERQIDQVRGLLQHAARTFDLRQVPQSTRRRVELESVLLLMEILDRLPSIDLEDAPGDFEVETHPDITGYTLPGTEIRITLDPEQTYPRRYLFSADTVSRLPRYYRQVKDLPKRDPNRPDLYKSYSISPGELLPSKWFWLIMALPPEFRLIYADQALWQWIGLGLVGFLALSGVALVVRRHKLLPRRTRRQKALARLVTPILILLIGFGFDETVDGVINITGDVSWWIDIGLDAIATMLAVWLAFLILGLIAEWIISSPRIGPESLDASLLRICFRLLGILVGAAILAYGAYAIGLPLVGVVAGLGVGGFALALAVKPTLENFIGFIILYSDRPIRVGERCKLGDLEGIVESIGIRSTRLRTSDGAKIVVQNTDFAQMRLVNLESRDRQELHEVLRLSPDTTRQQIGLLVDQIAKRLNAEEDVIKETLHVTFRGIGSYSLDLEISAQVASGGPESFKSIRSRLLLDMIRLVEEAGSSLAFMPLGLQSADPSLDGEGRDAKKRAAKQRAKEEEEAWKKAQAEMAQRRAELF